ncbi:hypothetical protein AB6D62_008420 [Vibrio cyclitrophicus]
MDLKPMFLISYVPLGYGSPQFLYLINNIKKSRPEYDICVFETFRFWIPFVELNDVDFKRVFVGRKFGKYLLKLKNKGIIFRILNYVNTLLSSICSNAYLIMMSYSKEITVIVTEPKIFYTFFSKKTKLIEYNLEVWEEETKTNNKLLSYRNRVDAVIFPQIDRLNLGKINYNPNTRCYLIENCCSLETTNPINSNKYNELKVIFSGKIGASGSFPELKLMIDHFNSNGVEVNIVGNFESSIETEARDFISKKENVIYHGFLKNTELRKLISNCNIGLISWKNNSINTMYCAPNKLYEYMSEGLFVISLDNVAMHDFHSKYGFGYVFEDESISFSKINLSSNNIKSIGMSNFRIVRDSLNYEAVSAKFIEMEL